MSDSFSPYPPFRWSGGRLSSSKALCSLGYAFPPSDRDPRFPHQRSTRPLASSQRRACIRSLLRSDKKLPRLKYHELNARHTSQYQCPEKTVDCIGSNRYINHKGCAPWKGGGRQNLPGKLQINYQFKKVFHIFVPNFASFGEHMAS